MRRKKIAYKMLRMIIKLKRTVDNMQEIIYNKNIRSSGRKGRYIMPVITRFYGVIIKMYFGKSEHNPPHVHATYGEYIGAIEI